MLTQIIPKLPMRDLAATKDFYCNHLGFSEISDYGNYWIAEKDQQEIHFFAFKNLDPLQNYGQVYIRVKNIEQLYQSLLDRNVQIHPNSPLATKPWGQKEFALLDPDHNLLTFGESIA